MSNGISIYVRLESGYTFFKFKCFTVGPELLLIVQKFVPAYLKHYLRPESIYVIDISFGRVKQKHGNIGTPLHAP